MMQKRTLYSLLIISFIVVFAASMSVADTVKIQSKSNLPRCANQEVKITADVTTPEVSAIELVLEISQTSGCAYLQNLQLVWDLGANVLPTREVVILSDGIAPDTIRAYAMYVDNGVTLAAGAALPVATLKFKTNDCCAGAVNIHNTVFDYPNETCDITTQIVAANGQNATVTVNPGVVSIANQIPTLADITDKTVAWGHPVSATAVGADADLANGCESISYSKVSGPGTMSGATWSWTPTGADVCEHTVVLKVTDECGGEATTSFKVCVTNEPPVITCPGNQLVFAGETLEVQATAVDPDHGPHPMVFSLVSTDFPGTLNVNPVTGEITMETEVVAAQTGFFQVCVGVSDSANVCQECSPSNSDECCFTVEVRSMGVHIEKIHNQLQGQETTLSIDMLPGTFHNWAIAGYDLLIAYDNSALTFLHADEGDFFTACGWEFFTYRQGADGNCGNGCPSGIVRIVALAESNNGAHHPSCFDNSVNEETQLATLTFLVSNNRTYECQYVPVKFFWVDCGDNGFSDVSGQNFLISRWVYDYYGDSGMDSWVEVTDLGADMPTYLGAPAECDVFTEKGEPVRVVDYFNGGVDIVCGESIDAVGDINLNAIAYEVADAVMFTNYFIEGLAAFGTHVQGSIAASDCNKDGIPLTVADLVHLIRVVVGDANPYPKLDVVHATYAFDDNVLSIDREMGAVFAVFEGQVNVRLLADNMEMKSGVVNGNTQVIVYPNAAGQTFSGDILAADGRLVSTPEFATYDGNPVAAKNVPRSFRVEQNYPNPFNPNTTIEFAMPIGGEWSVDIYNVAGQLVDQFSGTADPSVVKVDWNASNLASGVYFYRVNAGKFSQTKKAVLLK